LWFFPDVSLFARLALTMLGTALSAEGLGRLRAEAQKRQRRRQPEVVELPERIVEGVDVLGRLRAVYRTEAERVTDALAIALLGLAFACGEGYVIELLRGGAASPKLFVASLLMPFLVVYLLYRAVRHLYDRWCVLVFSEGLVCQHGSR